MMPMPALQTERLAVRPFVADDLRDVHRILDIELLFTSAPGDPARSMETRRRWLEWTIVSYEALAALYQPPYGDRAISLRQTGEIVGACGYVPLFAPFGQLDAPGSADETATPRLYTAEVGLFYAVAPSFQRHGYATEAARALVDYAFRELRLARIIATTTHDNAASTAVMRKLGMRLERNPLPEPEWFQVAGILENDHADR